MTEKILALDIESTGGDFIEGKASPFVLYGIDNDEKKYKWEFTLDPTSRVIVRDDKWKWNQLDIKQTCREYDRLVFHNGKFDLKGLQSIGITLDWRGKYADTQIMSHVLDNVTSHKLKDLGEIYLQIPKTSEKDLKDAVRACRRIVKKHLPHWKMASEDSKGESKDDTAVNLDYWLPKYILYELGEELEVIAKHNPTGDEHPWWNLCDRYGFNDVELTISLYLFFQEGLEKEGLTKVYEREISLLEDSLYEMEWEGIPIRPDAVERQLRDFRAIQDDHHETLMMISDTNYKSVNKDLPAYLFGVPRRNDAGEVIVKTSKGHFQHYTGFRKKDKSLVLDQIDSTPVFLSRENSLGLNPVKITKTNFSTDSYSINELLKQDITRKQEMYLYALQQVGQVTKAIQQLETLQKKIHNERVYCSFNQTGTKTTRFSCHNPNNQQISKGKEEENEDGEKEVKYKIRSVFGPEKGRVWYAIDYSQLQLRIFSSGEVAQEREMYDALCSESMDAHTFVGCKIFDCTPDNLTKIQRRVAKNCYHPNTEVLTLKGWKNISEVTYKDKVAQAIPDSSGRKNVGIDFVTPTDIINQPNESGKLIHFKNEGIDLRVTPDHRMLTWQQEGNLKRDNKEDMPITTFAKDTPKSHCWSNAGYLSNEELILKKEFQLRLAAAIQADGSFSGNRIRFGFKKESKIERLKWILNKLNIPFTEKPTGKKYTYTSITLSKFDCTDSLCFLEGKQFVWDLLNLDRFHSNVLLDEIGFWDAALSKGKCTMTRYYSSIKQNVDVIQAIANCNGRKTRLVKDSNGLWGLSIKNKPDSKGGNLTKEEIPYTGRVVCLSVPSSYLLVRDNGVPVISGNCNFGFVFGASPKKIELTAGVPGLWGTVTSMFPNAHKYMNQVKKQIKREGYVNTPWGYKLWVTSSHKGVNYIVQGCEGDIVKNAMIKCSRFLNSDEVLDLTDGAIHPLDVRLCFQVHDELIFDFPEEEFAGQHKSLLRGIKNRMELAGEEMGIKTPVDIEVIHHEGDWSNPQLYVEV